MAYKLIWSSTARDDLHDIIIFIARDSREHAMTFGYELISVTDQLKLFPEHSRIVPEYRNPICVRLFFAVTECLSRWSRTETRRDCACLALRARYAGCVTYGPFLQTAQWTSSHLKNRNLFLQFVEFKTGTSALSNPCKLTDTVRFDFVGELYLKLDQLFEVGTG